MTVELKRLTYEAYLALPEMKARYSIVDGELMMAADLMFIGNARRYIIGMQVIEGGPDLVMEALSPANTRRELAEKLQDYREVGVREAWIIGPQGRTVEVLQLSPEGSERSGLYGLGDAIVSQVLTEVHLTVDEIFPDL